MRGSLALPDWSAIKIRGFLLPVFATIAALISVLIPMAVAQQPSPQRRQGAIVRGTVVDPAGGPVGDASVVLKHEGASDATETKTNLAGTFVFSAIQDGSYEVSARKAEQRSRSSAIRVGFAADEEQVRLVLEDNPHAMEFADKPNFTVAGVTDWTAVGGHGSDSTLRTSEALARETAALKTDSSGDSASGSPGEPKETIESESKLRSALADAPGSFQANHQLGSFYLHAGRLRESTPLLQAAYRIDPANHQNEYDLAVSYKENGDLSQARDHVQKMLAHGDDANLHRLLAEIDEKAGDPLGAVHEDEKAVRQDPSESNYFAWGSELLLHRAVWQAADVFRNGTKAYPKSARMLAALGTALFAGALYDEAAASLCAASDLSPSDPVPYTFLGRIAMAAPKPLACVEPRLARFVHQQPANSLANYLYAMAILKRQEKAPDPSALQQVETLLTKAVTIDAECADAYLQLGILYLSRRQSEKAIDFYLQAIRANPQLGEAHYRLGVAYDRIGSPEKAKQEFQLHDQIEKLQAASVEQQRRQVKQFLIVLAGQPRSPLPYK